MMIKLIELGEISQEFANHISVSSFFVNDHLFVINEYLITVINTNCYMLGVVIFRYTVDLHRE